MSYTVCRYGTQSHIGECESLNKSIGKCEPTGENCNATRYVRADVAMRYARMRERKKYNQGISHGLYCGHHNCEPIYYEEAQQAWIKQNRGNVAQREGK